MQIMAAFTITIFLLISTFLILGGGYLAYSYSYLGDAPRSSFVLRWENSLYYIIAVYPIVSLMSIYLADVFYMTFHINTAPEYRNMGIFCAGHFILSILSVSIAKYLQKINKANAWLIIANVIAGSAYLFWAVIGFVNMAKQ